MSTGEGGEVAEAAAGAEWLVRGMNAPESRGRARQGASLSGEQIVAAAIEIADDGGLEAVSMRAVAARLGVGVMSLYWHIPGKDTLLVMMLDEVQGQIEVPRESQDGDWRELSERAAHAARAQILAHPWMASIKGVAAAPPIGPNTLHQVDEALGRLAGAGVDPATAMGMLTALFTYVMGAVTREIQEQRSVERYAALSDEERLAHQHRVAEVFDPGRFSHMAAVITAGIDPDDPGTRDERFQFGLTCMLDGLAAVIDRHRDRT